MDAAEGRCRELANEISAWLQHAESDNVYWVELENKTRTRIKLASAPLDVGPKLRSVLFDKIPTCVLTSATLCVGSPPKFDFIKSRLGLTRAETLALGSPFDYARQVTVHLPKNLPDPSDQPDLFERGAIRAIAHYLEHTQGKAFVLFTSYKMLDAAARALTPWLARRNIALFAQSDGMPRSKMVEAFKADINSVIFGADTFWQGVDVPGEALSNVIITRLPFSVPSHPLLEARLDDIRRRGGSPFVEYQVPEAVIKLKQGFGRLIRTKTDRGIVVILDPRVLTKPYGRTFLNSLPACPRIVETPLIRRCSFGKLHALIVRPPSAARVNELKHSNDRLVWKSVTDRAVAPSFNNEADPCAATIKCIAAQARICILRCKSEFSERASDKICIGGSGLRVVATRMPARRRHDDGERTGSSNKWPAR